MDQQPDEEKIKKIKLMTVIKAFLIIAFFYLISVGIILYFFPTSENRIIRKTAEIVPYPAASVGINFISVNKLEKNVNSVKAFYENQDFSKLGLRVDFSTQDGKKRLKIKRKDIINKMIEDLIIEKEAKKRNIEITQDIINQEVNRKLKEYGSNDFLKENLKKLYGWDLEDFKTNIVKPDLYKEKLKEYISKNNPSYVHAKGKMENALRELENKSDFSEVAKKYSEGESAKKGGELGWFNANQMLPEVAAEVFNLDKDEQSGIIQSSIGYHIVKVEDKKQENGVDMVKIAQIFVSAKTFPEWLLEAEKKYNIYIFSQNLKWNSQTGLIEFTDDEMKKYEENILKNPTNDPSLMF